MIIYLTWIVAGSILAWGISKLFGISYHSIIFIPLTVAPLLVKNGLAVGISISDDYPLVSYLSLSFNNPEQFIAQPSPRYWLLWPGILIMLLYSFTEVILSVIPLITCKRDPLNRRDIDQYIYLKPWRILSGGSVAARTTPKMKTTLRFKIAFPLHGGSSESCWAPLVPVQFSPNIFPWMSAKLSLHKFSDSFSHLLLCNLRDKLTSILSLR